MTITNNQPFPKNFQRLRREKGLTSRAVAEAAGISLREEYLFEIGGVVSDEIKQKIMQAFQQLTGQSIVEQPTPVISKVNHAPK
ncbi:MAG: helix-turn-helix domain-containing protein, partial [Ktedonobacteraceae bacterium]|nr:helix-turn-helix domain-containing protein [Ktedonobacteraceae bacterium]